jgi:hypothetical protein
VTDHTNNGIAHAQAFVPDAEEAAAIAGFVEIVKEIKSLPPNAWTQPLLDILVAFADHAQAAYREREANNGEQTTMQALCDNPALIRVLVARMLENGADNRTAISEDFSTTNDLWPLLVSTAAMIDSVLRELESCLAFVADTLHILTGPALADEDVKKIADMLFPPEVAQRVYAAVADRDPNRKPKGKGSPESFAVIHRTVEVLVGPQAVAEEGAPSA